MDKFLAINIIQRQRLKHKSFASTALANKNQIGELILSTLTEMSKHMFWMWLAYIYIEWIYLYIA